jgi:SagB-type dehydrogenase family enzyme
VVPPPIACFRRVRSLACYWNDGRFVAQNYTTRLSTPAPPLALEILEFCGSWRTYEELFARFRSCPRAPLKRLIALLVQRTLMERRADRQAARDRPDLIASWDRWMPEAAFFHFATKDQRYGSQRQLDEYLVAKAATDPPPPPTKAYPETPRTPLPPAASLPPLSEVLRQRRTWRRFGSGPLELEQIATLLGLTWGVQTWVQTRAGPCALKTSPSGGARHAIEAYLLARKIKGVARGCYYYDPDAHELALVKRGLTASRLEQYVARQSCYRDAAAVVAMTAVFARSQWRYGFPRAYRVVLLDAGHLCQTFCLVATALGLAPFCTAALGDSTIERDLGLDGVTESVLYACGVGARPSGVEWAPWPDSPELPPLIPPKHQTRRLRADRPSRGRTRKPGRCTASSRHIKTGD